MDLKHQFKIFKRASARYGLQTALWLMRHLPFRVTRGVMHFFMFLWFRFAIKLRRIARESLAVAFGDQMDVKEKDRIVRDCFENIGRSLMDLIYYTEHPQEVREKFVIEGQEHLARAMESGRGVIVVTAHFGNFCLMLLEMAQLGYKTHCIIRRTRDAEIVRRIDETMNRVGVHPIYSLPARRSVQESLRVLRENGLLCILLDQHFGSGSGVFVDFFGRKAATATGPVVLANRTDAPILLVFTIREGDRYRIIIEPPLTMERGRTDEETVKLNVSRITGIIERYIRRYPAEWGWMHRRWKH